MIFTSYFANLKNLPEGIRKLSIARRTPLDIDIDSFSGLFPSAELVFSRKTGHTDIGQFDKQYRSETLSCLDARRLKKELNGSVLLCYEKPNDFCHRKIVRKWFAESSTLALEW